MLVCFNWKYTLPGLIESSGTNVLSNTARGSSSGCWTTPTMGVVLKGWVCWVLLAEGVACKGCDLNPRRSFPKTGLELPKPIPIPGFWVCCCCGGGGMVKGEVVFEGGSWDEGLEEVVEDEGGKETEVLPMDDEVLLITGAVPIVWGNPVH